MPKVREGSHGSHVLTVADVVWVSRRIRHEVSRRTLMMSPLPSSPSSAAPLENRSVWEFLAHDIDGLAAQ
jgi:hypothetical protein